MSRQVKITFERSLSSEEENKLIGRMKGFVEDVREGLVERSEKLMKKQKFLNAIALVGAQSETVRMQLQAVCTKTVDSEGKESSMLEKKFSLVKESPMVYSLTFPNIGDLVVLPGGKNLVGWVESSTRNEIGGVRQMIGEAGLGPILKEIAHQELVKPSP